MIHLEDNYTDIINKAQVGLGINDRELASRAGISPSVLLELQSGTASSAALAAVAPILHLHLESLLQVANDAWRPKPVAMSNLHQSSTDFHGMLVNSYLIWNPESRSAAIFDTGATCQPFLEFLTHQSLKLTAIFLSHSHRDHIADLSHLINCTGAPAFSSDREPVEGTQLLSYGDTFNVGALMITARQTTGHSRGGVTYVVEGLSNPVAIVGDALFAGSMGGAPRAWAEALDTNRTAIFSLPDATVVCPGHGPMTTVSEEKAHNPLFPEFKG